MDYRIVFHPAAQAELERLYDDIAERASPAIAWNFRRGYSRPLSRSIDFSTAWHRAARDHARTADHRLPTAVSIAFAVEGERVLILGIFYAGRNITPEWLEAAESRSGKVRSRRADSGFQSEAYGPKRVSQARPSAKSDVETQPSQLTNLDPADISTRNRKNFLDRC